MQKKIDKLYKISTQYVMPEQILTFETRAAFKGFDAHYEHHILPFLMEKEQVRKISARKSLTYGPLTTVVIAVGAAIFAMRSGHVLPAIFIVIFGIFAGFGVGYFMVFRLEGQTKLHLMNSICKFLGWKFSEDGFAEPDLKTWKTNKLLPTCHRAKFEDQMRGTENGAEFTFCEAHLERESRDSKGNRTWSTVFRGILLEVDFHRKFLGRTVVLRDAGIFNFKKKAGMKKVGLVDPKFEKIFEAYGTDQVEARYLLTPVFMQKLVDLEQSVSGKKIRFGFLNNKLHVAVQAPNQFEAGSMFKPLTDKARTQKIMAEVGAVLDVIQGVGKANR